VGGASAAAIAASEEAYRKHEQEKRQQLERTAAKESEEIAAPDTGYESNAPLHRQVADSEATQIAMEDRRIHPAYRPVQHVQGALATGNPTGINEKEFPSPSAAELKGADAIPRTTGLSDSVPPLESVISKPPVETPGIAGDGSISRPSIPGNESMTSISQLHVPGEYPREKKVQSMV